MGEEGRSLKEGVGLACARVVTGQRSGKLTKATDSTLGVSWGGLGVELFTAIVARQPGAHGAKPDESADRLNYKPRRCSLLQQKPRRKLWENQYDLRATNGNAK